MKFFLLTWALWSLGTAVAVHSAEQKKLKDVDMSALAMETERVSNAGGLNLAWWMPPEFWEGSLVQRGGMSDKQIKEFVDGMRGYSMLAVTQGKADSSGEIDFFDRDTISKGLKVEMLAGKEWKAIQPVEKVPLRMQTLLAAFGPILEASLGKLGHNLQFFVYDDDAGGKRLLSPYESNSLRVTMANKEGDTVGPFVIEMPLDALFVPRMCPNGKPANISWVVCPWDGSALPK